MTARRRKGSGGGTDPLTRACPACGARKGQGCKTVGKNSKPLITRATRLVHADRLEGATTDA